MEKYTTITSKIMPLPMKDVDTDMILPAQFLTSISRDGWEANLFRRLREQDQNFPLNQARYEGAKVLVSDSNFGCGSSREHAVWALTGYGFRVVIAKSFADIFAGNSGKNGLLLVTLPDAEVDSLLESAAQRDTVVTVSLDEQTVTMPDGRKVAFQYEPFRKHCMQNGLDDIDYILSAKFEIDQFRKKQEENRFMRTTDAIR